MSDLDLNLKKLICFSVFFLLLLLNSCIGRPDDDNIEDINIGRFPLEADNKWIYDIQYGYRKYTDSSSVIDVLPYQINDLESRYLFLYKELSLSYEILTRDTMYVQLLDMDTDFLIRYGREKTDRSYLSIYETTIFEDPHILVNYILPVSNTLLDTEGNSIVSDNFVDVEIENLTVFDKGTEKVLGDTLIKCIKTENIFSGTGYSGTYYSLEIYYSDLGILKYSGYVNGKEFSAKLKRVHLY